MDSCSGPQTAGGRTPRASQTWFVDLDGQRHRIQLAHSYWSGRNVLSVDDVIVRHDKPSIARLAAHCFGLTEVSTRVRGHELTALISPSDSFDLVVDGRSAAHGELVPPLPRPPHDALYRLGILGGATALVAMPSIFVVTFLFGRFAPDWGPRWFAANDLVLTSGLVPFMAGVGICMVSFARLSSSLGSRLFGGLFGGLACLWTAAVGVVALPGDIAEVIGPPDTLDVMVVESITRDSRTPAIRTADGVTYEWKTSYGLYDYPKISPGKYQIVLTPARHQLVAIRPAN
jgi:hypothetical protein